MKMPKLLRLLLKRQGPQRDHADVLAREFSIAKTDLRISAIRNRQANRVLEDTLKSLTHQREVDRND